MGTLCFSQALILRCESLSETEDIALFIPTCVEVLFTTSLIFRTWSSGRWRLFLILEGWVYFALALLELLSHIIPAVRDQLDVFKPIDIILGILSSLPLLLYTIFLCFFTCTKLLDAVPFRLRKFGKFMLILLIPVLLALNEVSSFIGITHRRFSSPQNKTLWTIFTDFDLGFITGYQALSFFFAFLRLAKAFLEQQRIESSDSDEALLFRGTAWVALGIKLGAIESAIGFVPSRFGLVLARRILRALGRGSLVIGVFKGLDVSENFQIVREEILAGKQERSFRGSRIRPLISNPRLSTFQTFSPEPTRNGNAVDVYPEKESRAIFRTPMTPGQRVTVHFDAASGRAPTLQMRFSALDMPSPAEIVESVRTRPASEWLSNAPSRRSSYYANSTMTRHTIAMPPLPPSNLLGMSEVEPQARPMVNDYAFAHSRNVSNLTANSGFRDSVNSSTYSIGRDLASRFPGLPPRVTNSSQPQAAQMDSMYVVPEAALSKSTLSHSNSFRRKPAPRASVVLAPTTIDPFSDEETTGVDLPTPLGATEHANQMSMALSTAPTTDTVFTRPRSFQSSSYFTTPTTAQTDPFKYDTERRRGRISELPSVDESPNQNHSRGKSMETLDISWLQRPVSEDYEAYSEEAIVQRALRTKISGQRRSRSAPRIKSIGKAPRRYTPSLTTTGHTRESIYIEPIIIPSSQYGIPNVELEQGSLNGSALSPLRNSSVLVARNES
ncbi:hypothetical protein BDP27DRAFT_6215 [Rhodocollybia butyracea]|uniref:Uncharacterized protein n=1 Tax=Rhodocollybia butyracea TaxID=206335 RepID=A0A9P5QAY1_9AGAR|nr:hypothetical protein BDP27DRAFT_6215 [Rhodocollybia butyracea]